MRTVRIGDLEGHLSRYLRVVRKGTRLIVVEGNKAIAEIGPPPPRRDPAPGIRAELIRRGVLIAARRPSLRLHELGAPVACRGDAVKALRDDREGR